jgi:hypothetical protein
MRLDAAPRDFRLDIGGSSWNKVVAIRNVSRPQRWLSVAALICGIFLIAFGLFSAAALSTTHNAAALLPSGASSATGSNIGCSTCRTDDVPQATHVPGAGMSSVDKTPQATNTPFGTQAPASSTASSMANTPQRETTASDSAIPIIIITLGLLAVIAGGAGLFYTRPR